MINHAGFVLAENVKPHNNGPPDKQLDQSQASQQRRAADKFRNIY